MLKVTLDDLPESNMNIDLDGDACLLDFLSDDEYDDEEVLRRCSELEELVTLTDRFPNTIIFVGLPIVGKDKYNKLFDVVTKTLNKEFLSRNVRLSQPFTLEIYQDENGKTHGVGFVTCSRPEEARAILPYIKGLRLDSSHIFKAALIDDFDFIISDNNVCKPPASNFGFTREEFRSWLMDPRTREQFVIRYKDETEIHWWDPIERGPVLQYDGSRERAQGKRLWTDSLALWSNHGLYLATFHKKGIALHAGDNFERKLRCEHNGVRHISFSPGDEYLLTWDGTPHNPEHDRAVCIWQVITGDLLRSFPTPPMSPKATEFPHFLWNYNGTMIAKMERNEDSTCLCVYSLPSMTLVPNAQGKKTRLLYPAEKFDWSPADNIISIVIPGTTDTPARLVLVEMPSRKELASRNIYNVCGASMHWQEHGDYLCLKTLVTKKTGKRGKKQLNQLEIFKLREKNIPVDTIQIEGAVVKQMHWEVGVLDGSRRFALIVKDEETGFHSIRFYRIRDTGAISDTVWSTTFDVTSHLNHMEWSPAGNYFVLGCLGAEGTLLFCCLNDNDKVEVIHKDEHFMVNNIVWSACGRYVATCVCVPMPSLTGGALAATYRYSAEAGYCIWGFQGKLLYKVKKESLYTFSFRPHPTSLLPRDEIDKIRKNIKAYSKRYDAIDEQARVEQQSAYIAKRQSNVDSFRHVVRSILEKYRQNPLSIEYENDWATFDSQFEWEDSEYIIQQVIETREEYVS